MTDISSSMTSVTTWPVTLVLSLCTSFLWQCHFITEQRYALVRSLLSPVFVHLSRWWIVSRWLKIYVKLLSRPSSPIILDFCLRALVPNSKGNSFNRGAKYTGVAKFCDFRLKSLFISETVQDRPIAAMER